MYGMFQEFLSEQLAKVKAEGLHKHERVIESPQCNRITVNGREVLNLCANNYLGLADHPLMVEAAHEGLEKWGLGTASVRFICGTQGVHADLERALSTFLGTEETILYSSCFDANGGLFETLLGPEDAILSDALNHASIIDGVRLCKAKRFRYQNNDMQDLESQLQQAEGCRFRMIATDGVFSMDGSLANLPEICDLAEKYNALVMVDDSHAVGLVGKTGRGTPEHFGVTERIDILTGTLGKALGGASGGYTSGRKEIVDWLRQRSRPYLFSNSLAPPIAATALRALQILKEEPGLLQSIQENTRFFREGITKIGLKVLPGEHPIIPIMIGDATLAAKMADALLESGLYVIGFSYPVVPQGLARIRTQISASHTREDLEFALEQFAAVKEELNIPDDET
ncbi:2-amino-3-ketobutyrate coenzyme A ligase [Thalassoglobus neptunius]|uniref:2-amino-3-ketobutyrate coenzyme A ligase n=1 Tax=Thalassoglobus neptunius TaxID=1938619 RepID=A0A5C5WXG9_9PLAN|nr:glycine C-acetyltransferase [Thalassoglobus neptunius]TWT55270.1 2-amino-3-ketobutyrate coenzyme A ligase [Thalassoglobus neptunius]